jgi:hypothetical protein
MNKSSTFNFITERQRHWAQTQGLTVSGNGRVSRLEDNLFAPLHAETRADFEAGDGDEFGTPDDVGKMYSLHSSSALACNVFDYWRKRPMLPLLRACGFDTRNGSELKFEQKFSTGVGRKPANLDVLITDSAGGCPPVAIESKFTEPFQTGERDCLRPAYFSKSPIWDELPVCRAIAEGLTARERFKFLKASQLLKHALALTRKHGKKRFVLLYLWYDVNGSNAAKQHGAEVREFGNLLADEVLFRSDSYHNVFDRLFPSTTGTAYEAYLRSRYFA